MKHDIEYDYTVKEVLSSVREAMRELLPEEMANGVRLYVEIASLESSASDIGSMRIYWHVLVQHSSLDGFRVGIGHHSIDGLIRSFESQVVPELEMALVCV